LFSSPISGGRLVRRFHVGRAESSRRGQRARSRRSKAAGQERAGLRSGESGQQVARRERGATEAGASGSRQSGGLPVQDGVGGPRVHDGLGCQAQLAGRAERPRRPRCAAEPSGCPAAVCRLKRPGDKPIAEASIPERALLIEGRNRHFAAASLRPTGTADTLTLSDPSFSWRPTVPHPTARRTFLTATSGSVAQAAHRRRESPHTRPLRQLRAPPHEAAPARGVAKAD